MSKWTYLIEADRSFRELERAHKANPGDSTKLIAYMASLVRSNMPVKADLRFTRLSQEFMEESTEAKAKELQRDLARINGPTNKVISETCNLMGKMRNVCHQANQTEYTTTYFIILVSYAEPVAYKVRSSGHEFYTQKNWSVTANRHIRTWTGYTAEAVPQAELDQLWRNTTT